ncbi:hypothetical protein [Mycobacterium riyadhense]|uniref:Uncharacterized protein n=1 Tax=Mycobacterium riyadhense TaxID=486698 RepID=A0A1X2D512_9MYCO|nr:hypothetical protein [Mycobacterium riyadhense]MCV7146507.1 hypothetical protein [Mycobacterium riyadhense]ORW83141.1 hypothetical protein AWC22_15425 [Mycobacterium riyadhense]
MADRLDVAGRLAEGRVAVEHTQSYVLACRRVGCASPDLDVRDWYDSEDGLDLHALDGDCAQLRAAAAAVTEALRMQRAQVTELAAAWTGPGADAAVRFLLRHCDAASDVVTEIRAAAQRCESLRDNLWQLVDAKVATAIAIDDRTLAQRPVWLAAAGAVTTGVGDRTTGEQLVRQQIAPYVDNDIRNDWLTAMQSTRAGVATAYDMVTDRLAAAPRACFEIPGDFGPVHHATTPAPRAAVPAAIAPAVASPALPPDAAPAIAPVTGVAPVGPVPSDLAAAMGDGPAIPTGSGGLADFGGLGGLAGRIVQAMDGLLGSAADQLAGTSFGEGMPDDDPDDVGDAEVERPETAEETDESHDHEQAEEQDEREEPPPGEQIHGVAEKTATPLVAPPVAPPAAEPPPAATPPPAAGPPPRPAPAGSTPCEIAADELPKAGQ